MTRKIMRGEDGFYHVKNKKFQLLEGSRAQVWLGTAFKTPGGLTREQLLKNKHGEIVSKKKHLTAKREKRLEKHGFFTKKGKFGFVKKSVKGTRKNSKKVKK